jgi:formylglycine-generating enzyme required for sulfatase activity
MSALSLPPEFDGYRITRLIGQGGMGQVFLAHDTLLDRLVAIKLISAADADEAARRRFFVEARAIARISHPNVVSIYRAGEVLGRPYIVSEYVPGVGLDKVPIPLPSPRVLAIGLGVARGLSTAHRQGVIHRDIKPANLLITEDGEPKLLDFGIAKLLDPASPGARREPDDAPFLVDEDDGGREDEVTRAVSRCTLEQKEEPAEDAAPAATRARHALGTPLYMAPEIWRGEEAAYASDVYSLGALLYTLAAGRPPHLAGSIAELGARVVTSDARPLADAAQGVDPHLAAIVDRCLARDPTRRFRSASELRAALAQLTPEAREGVVPEGNPYRGLRVFEEQHGPLFFGRDSETRGILERLRAEPCVAVTGDSGVGKSSICRAAVLPRTTAWLDGDRRWSRAALVPGAHPVAALAAALAPHLGTGEAELSRRMTEDPSAPARELRGRLGRAEGLVIFIDQLEEICTLSDAREAITASEVLGWLVAPSPSLRLLATVRGDFLGRLAALPAIGDVVARSLYVLRPLTAERIREAVVGPAHALGVRFESEAMIDALVAAAMDAEGALPLLQFALAELWEARDVAASRIPAAALEALGGVVGALRRHADDVLARLVSAEARAARRVVVRLVTASGTRARRTGEDLVSGGPHARAALDALVRGRLVVARESPEGSCYEIAHEALIAPGGPLWRWLSLDAEVRAVRERLAAAVAEWRRLGRAREALWSARQLTEIATLDADDLSADEAGFVAASRRAIRRGTLARSAAVAAVPLALGVGYGAVALETQRLQARRIDAYLQRGEAALVEARAARAEAGALRREAFAQIDRREREAAETTWSRARAVEAKIPATYGRANQEIETALMLAPARADLRARFADLLLERVIAAEEQRGDGRREELVARLAVYDDGGVRAAELRAPARLSITARPAGAQVLLARYVERETGRLHLEPARDLGASPVPRVDAEPGSYLLTFTAPGRATVRYPLSLGRAAREAISLELPLADDVPPGFAYVPEGRFLFGSAADDTLRRTFLNTVPMHEVHSHAYLIALRETTFGDWITYLASLPAAERPARFPRVDKGGFKGALAFTQGPGESFDLALAPAGHVLRAGAGEPLVYPARALRASQDWRRLPVSGVDVADAEAYLRWLDATGRVRGARLCTEQEWERAARGGDGRTYPHGERLDADDADFDETYGKAPLGMGPDEVGSHPATRSAFGLDDVVGNVWEWTTSSLAPGEYVARGGSFYFNASSNRADNREVSEPSLRDVSVGLRVCADALIRRADPAREHADPARACAESPASAGFCGGTGVAGTLDEEADSP